MKWLSLTVVPILLISCTLFELDEVRDKEVVLTDKPNSLLEPFCCGDRSIDVTTTKKVLK